MKTMCGKNFKERMLLEKFLYFKVETGHLEVSYPFRSFAVISTKNIVRTFRHLDLKDKNLALNHAGSFGTIPGPMLGKYRLSDRLSRVIMHDDAFFERRLNRAKLTFL